LSKLQGRRFRRAQPLGLLNEKGRQNGAGKEDEGPGGVHGTRSEGLEKEQPGFRQVPVAFSTNLNDAGISC
jgi:hypothetical protein